jgi:signal peptidase II
MPEGRTDDAPPARAPRRWILWGVAGAVVALDQGTKAWAQARLAEPVDLGPVVLRLTYNTGTAFSLGASLGPLIAVLAVVVVVVLLRLGRGVRGRLPLVLLGLVVGGAVGNLVDRAFRDGGGFLRGPVVDWIDLGWWPVFNVADMAIVVGAFTLAVVGGLLPTRADPEQRSVEVREGAREPTSGS